MGMRLALEHGLMQGQHVHVFSNQSWFENRIKNLAFTAAKVDVSRVRAGLLDAHEEGRLATAERALAQAPIKFHYVGKTSIRSLPKLVRQALQSTVKPHGALVLIDYRQWNGPQIHGNSQQLVHSLAGLKRIVGQHKATVVVLSSIGRHLEIRADKRPHLTDLPNCLVDDPVSDQTWLLYRRGLYAQNEVAPSFKVEVCCCTPQNSTLFRYEIQLGMPVND